ncbi:MAG TPA: gephyrin-like molybdotransferase Glp [Thermomicrobiales bacterium]|nr:gephyrin-like molybdotransferase Glp [Thermomicrobiales bacterium]
MPEPETPLSERPWEAVERMLGVDEALARMLAAFAPLPAVDAPILDGLGLTLAEDVRAVEPTPPFRNSAMDGYAVRAGDTDRAAFAAGVRLRVVGMGAAGAPAAARVEPGTAVRIMTGAPMPDGADAVVRFEETDEGRGASGRTVTVFHPAAPGDNVREAGEDVPAGSVVLAAGRRLRPADIGLLASVNRTSARVRPRARVAILSTGDEVVEPGAPLDPGQIRNSNSYTLAAMAREWGASVRLLGVARDRADALAARLDEAADADLIVTSGGVSVGDFDLVKDVLRRHGEVSIWQVRMKPGKPLAFGAIGGTPLLGLPGNPAAAAVSFLVFGRPAIARMMGQPESWPHLTATIAEPLDNRGMRRHYVRVRLEPGGDGCPVARPLAGQGAGVLSGLANADALLIVPETIERAEPGMRFDAIPLHPD